MGEHGATPKREDTRWRRPGCVVHRGGVLEPWLVGQCGTSEVVTGTPGPDIQGSTQSLGGESLRSPSGEPRFNAGLIKGTVGVPGRVGDASHRTPHYGPPGQESLQPKRVPQINLQGGSRDKEERHRERQSKFPRASQTPSRGHPRPFSFHVSGRENHSVCRKGKE